jgi:hypothetical protein
VPACTVWGAAAEDGGALTAHGGALNCRSGEAGSDAGEHCIADTGRVEKGVGTVSSDNNGWVRSRRAEEDASNENWDRERAALYTSTVWMDVGGSTGASGSAGKV